MILYSLDPLSGLWMINRQGSEDRKSKCLIQTVCSQSLRTHAAEISTLRIHRFATMLDVSRPLVFSMVSEESV